MENSGLIVVVVRLLKSRPRIKMDLIADAVVGLLDLN